MKPVKDIRYSAYDMMKLESKLLTNAMQMAGRSNFGISTCRIESAIDNQNADMQTEISESLNPEQEQAIRNLTGEEQLACVIGVAGAGKSTILDATREAWEQSGHRVLGATLAGKAAKGLEQSSDIKSRTLASFEL